MRFGGGPAGTINGDALESAIGRPYTGYYSRIWSKAAALAQSMIGNHPFTDGNKRTALIVTNLLLNRSGYRVVATARAESEDFFVKVAAARGSFEEIEEWFKARIIREQ